MDDVLPAVFEKGNPGYHSRILPAIEGCVYPLYFVETAFLPGPVEKLFLTPSRRSIERCVSSRDYSRRIASTGASFDAFHAG